MIKNLDIVPLQFNSGEKAIMIECSSTPFLCLDIENQNLKNVAENYPHLKNLILSGCSSDGKKRIDNLIGADNYYHFIYGNIIRGKIHEPVAVESSFRWLVTGYFENLSPNTFVNLNSIHVLRMTTHVISENAISETNVISKDKKISFNSVVNPFDTEKNCYKNKPASGVYIKSFKKDLKCNGTRLDRREVHRVTTSNYKWYNE